MNVIKRARWSNSNKNLYCSVIDEKILFVGLNELIIY